MFHCLTRRQFLGGSVAAAATIGLPGFAAARVLGANDEIRMAVIGCGVRGGVHVAEFGRQKGVRIAAVCDPDRTRSAAFAQLIETSYGYKPDEVLDVRKLMDRKDLDVVSVATMQYWHALPTIWACQTGRHVYVEKPLAHYIWEGRQMVGAARKYDRLVQIGTQSRSQRGYAAMAGWLKAGHLGKILYVTCFANKPRRSIGKRKEPLPIPATLDYELWCGPARKEPVYRDKIQYDCSFTWNMGDGESCNQGVHEVDVARWILGYTGLPRRTMSIGGRFLFDDAGDVPNTQIICYDYPEVPILYEVHNLPKNKECLTPQKWSTQPDFRGQKTGVCVQCEGGYTLGTTAFDPQGKKLRSFGPGENHFENFIHAVRSGRREDLHAEIEEGHRSTSICHAGNISYRLGRPASLDEQQKQFGELACWRQMHERYVKYLGQIGVDPGLSTLGPWLECDAANECIKDNAKANEIVKGFYRQPFVVPEINSRQAAVSGDRAMGGVRVCHLDDARGLAPIREFFEHENPGLKLDVVAVDGQSVLASGQGGMRVFWIYGGEGQVFLPRGYRTQEGDGKPLPGDYRADPIDPAFAKTLSVIQKGLASLSPVAAVAARAILGRRHGEAYLGNYAGELWKLDHLPRPWSTDEQVEAALGSLFTAYREQGHSTKQAESWEPVLQGDQLIACAEAPIRVRGRFRCLSMENVHRPASHVSAVRRLRYLADTAGGCNPDFDPFRRLPLTWYYNYPGQSGDGLNWVNSHVVNIPKETSPSHFHPSRGIGAAGGIPQREMYLTLDPAAYRLKTWGRKASLLTFPELADLRFFRQHPLEPAMFIYIPPGTGHRGLDVLVNVLTIPGFKPHNEYYLDRDIRDTTGGTVPFNENLLEAKNYARIEDLL